MTAPTIEFVQPRCRPLRVLVADDNRDAADSLAELLRIVGCDVAACYDGGAAVELAEKFRPDVCILDLLMPVLDGWKVARQLRQWAVSRPLLLIALSGFAARRAEEAPSDAGFDHFLLKPCAAEEIFRDFAAFIKRMEPAVLQLV